MVETILFQGISAAPGLAQGPIMIWQENDLQLPEPYYCDDSAAAYQRICSSVDKVADELKKVRDRALDSMGKEEAAIFEAHLMILKDCALHDLVKSYLTSGKNPESAWYEAYEKFAHTLAAIPDPIFSARAADIRDVGRNVLTDLLGIPNVNNELSQPSILVARDFSPSQTATIDPKKVLAFCTSEGGPTSHTAILAKALGIPAVVALGDQVLGLQPGLLMIVNALNGQVIINPTVEQQRDYLVQKKELDVQKNKDLQSAFEPAFTADGIRVEVVANIGSASDAEEAMANGAEGVGLFRTEFLFLNNKALPSINEQVNTYQQVIKTLDGRPLVVRTMDIGGDKSVDYLGIVSEPNPFLGWRGIRMMSEKPDLLRDQFTALLKAGLGTDLRVMLPMVSQVSEVIQAKKIFMEVLDRTVKETGKSPDRIQFGIMVEVPSTALIAEHFAPYVDFYSIGTNDLTQYTMAVDRMNSRVAPLASAFAPAVLKLIERTIRQAHLHHKWVGMCGELAGEPAALPFLLGLGLDEYSMSASSIPAAKRILKSLKMTECQDIAHHVLELPSAEIVLNALKTWMKDHMIE